MSSTYSSSSPQNVYFFTGGDLLFEMHNNLHFNRFNWICHFFCHFSSVCNIFPTLFLNATVPSISEWILQLKIPSKWRFSFIWGGVGCYGWLNVFGCCTWLFKLLTAALSSDSNYYFCITVLEVIFRSKIRL